MARRRKKARKVCVRTYKGVVCGTLVKNKTAKRRRRRRSRK